MIVAMAAPILGCAAHTKLGCPISITVSGGARQGEQMLTDLQSVASAREAAPLIRVEWAA
jgi:hypothetical protein